MTVALRPPVPADLAALGEVAYQTGFFGESAARYFPDRRLFTLLWVWPYLHGAGGPGCLVAEVNGQVQGYILGNADPARYRQVVTQAGLLGAAASLGGEVYRPQDCWRYLLRLARHPAPHADERLYPAHLHINLLPGNRGLGLGKRLLGAHLDALRASGVPGVQLSTTAENVPALGLYRRLGFQELAHQESDLWTPWLGHPTAQIVMGLRLSRL
ncbi:GNAT family N-acetyltransferase [Deinococcus sp. Marseille-Q6407]|uniref:GNAT family N-acetyltransferase n=1 Tax=Deinococcus sp. Marseille-Q6407 TaxID=2969223 RepID=UPI0021C1BDD2|nr:GNAT family N-acetyltransferase [Deinococcus sp. Marseille-Q6407]